MRVLYLSQRCRHGAASHLVFSHIEILLRFRCHQLAKAAALFSIYEPVEIDRGLGEKLKMVEDGRVVGRSVTEKGMPVKVRREDPFMGGVEKMKWWKQSHGRLHGVSRW